jgi:hypothetical protein
MTDVDIAGFVAQCLDEDTEDAKYVHRWDCDAFDGGSLGDCNCGIPQQLLADIAAKRAIIEAYRTSVEAHEAYLRSAALRTENGHASVLAAIRGTIYGTLCRLAEPYAARPGFKPTWRFDG